MRCQKCGYQNTEDALSCNLCQEILKKKNLNNEFVPYFRKDEIQKPESKNGLIILTVLVITIAGIYFYPLIKAKHKINVFNRNVIKSELPVLVDFYAPWCPLCQAVAPIIEELKIEYENRIVIYKINIDENKDLINSYNISSIPAFIFFKKGKMAGRITGSASKELLKSKISEILSQQEKSSDNF